MSRYSKRCGSPSTGSLQQAATYYNDAERRQGKATRLRFDEPALKSGQFLGVTDIYNLEFGPPIHDFRKNIIRN